MNYQHTRGKFCHFPYFTCLPSAMYCHWWRRWIRWIHAYNMVPMGLLNACRDVQQPVISDVTDQQRHRLTSRNTYWCGKILGLWWNLSFMTCNCCAVASSLQKNAANCECFHLFFCIFLLLPDSVCTRLRCTGIIRREFLHAQNSAKIIQLG